MDDEDGREHGDRAMDGGKPKRVKTGPLRTGHVSGGAGRGAAGATGAAGVTKACRYCKTRKVKCDSDRRVPCTSCTRAGKECVPSSDGRSLRPSTHELQDLRGRVAQLEAYIEGLTGERAAGGVLGGGGTGGATAGVNAAADGPAEPAGKYPRPKAFQRIGTSTVSPETYGPTSIFHSATSPLREREPEKGPEPVAAVSLKTLNKDATVIRYIKCFFQWLYPDIHMFVPRETFLIDFYHPRTSRQQSYCTPELVYAVCAIGALLAPADEPAGEAEPPPAEAQARARAQAVSERFYAQARELLWAKLEAPSVTSLQAFLLLGLYDMYRGRNSSCWLLSGVGLRLGFDVGFHLSPNLASSKRSINRLSLLFKSRIYWGCFIVDHFIGMILGRPSVLHIDDSTLEDSGRVPDLDWITDFNFKDKDIIDVSNPLTSIIRLIVLAERSMHGIFVLEHSVAGKYARLAAFNRDLAAWRAALLPELRWPDTDALRARSTKPPDMVHVYYYYIVLLCVNRPFLDPARDSPDSLADQQQRVRDDVVVPAVATLDLAIAGFVAKYGCRRCSILIVYSSILVASVVLLIIDRDRRHNRAAPVDHPLLDLLLRNLHVLRDAGTVWGLARDSFAGFERKLLDDLGLSFAAEHDRLRRRAESPPPPSGPPDTSPALDLAGAEVDFGTEWTEWMGLIDAAGLAVDAAGLVDLDLDFAAAALRPQ